MKKCILLCLFAPLLFIACSDDDYVYPNVLTEMIDLVTDNTGTATYLKSAEGEIWSIQPRAGLDCLTPDSVYRTVTMYAPVNTSQPSSLEAILYNTQIAISPIPKAKDTFKEIHTDPVAIQSIWRSGDYLNLIALAMVKDRTHEFHFIDNGITHNEDGTKTLNLTLYHDRHDDVEGFNRKVYLSVPLRTYADVLQKGDKIIFTLNTYKEGMTSRSFTY